MGKQNAVITTLVRATSQEELLFPWTEGFLSILSQLAALGDMVKDQL